MRQRAQKNIVSSTNRVKVVGARKSFHELAILNLEHVDLQSMVAIARRRESQIERHCRETSDEKYLQIVLQVIDEELHTGANREQNSMNSHLPPLKPPSVLQLHPTLDLDKKEGDETNNKVRQRKLENGGTGIN